MATSLSRLIPIAVLAVVCGAPCVCQAVLTSDQVLVVANANVPESLELARHYMAGRQIPPENLVTVATTPDYLVSRSDYDSQIRLPIRAAMIQRNLRERIKAVVLMWGVPVRVGSPENPQAQLNAAYKLEAARAHHQMALGYKLLNQPAVGATGELEPFVGVFGDAAGIEPRPLPAVATLRKDLQPAMNTRMAAIEQIKDPSQRDAAWRGLLAISLSVRGLEGLTATLQQHPTAWSDRARGYQAELTTATAELNKLPPKPTDAQTARRRLDLIRRIGGAMAVQEFAAKGAESTAPPTADAAVDSELALVWWEGYPLDRWLVNPLHVSYRAPEAARNVKLPPVLMACRIDGPSAADARRIIDDSLAVERTGLAGTFYVDIGGPQRAREYDQVLEGLVKLAGAKGGLKVEVERSPALFKEKSCPQAALYVGWYSLQKYVDSFTWVRGAVAYHIASFEAMHLRDPASNEWCVQLIRRGAAATIGAVDEPYLQTMPHADGMFPLIMTGKLTLAEAYWRMMPTVSWRVTLIGDPLYRPFAASPQMRAEDLPKPLQVALSAPVGEVVPQPAAPAATSSAPAAATPAAAAPAPAAPVGAASAPAAPAAPASDPASQPATR